MRILVLKNIVSSKGMRVETTRFTLEVGLIAFKCLVRSLKVQLKVKIINLNVDKGEDQFMITRFTG